MPAPTDEILARYCAEIEERKAFIDGLLVNAQESGEDLDDGKMEMITRARDRISQLNEQMKPLEDARRIVDDSRQRVEQITHMLERRGNLPHQGRIPVRRRVRGRHVACRARERRLARAAGDLQPRRLAPDDRRQRRPAPRADPRPGRQLHRHRPPLRVRASARGSCRPGRGHGRG